MIEASTGFARATVAEVHAVDHGVIADGTTTKTDNSAALAAAVAEANTRAATGGHSGANGAGKVVLPAGTVYMGSVPLQVDGNMVIEGRQEVRVNYEVRELIVAGIVRDGMAQGHVTLPDNMTPEAVVFGLWSMTEGAYSIIATSDSMAELGIAEPFPAIRNNIHHMLDGYGWTPLSGDEDLNAAMEKIVTEVFPNEFARLKQPW